MISINNLEVHGTFFPRFFLTCLEILLDVYHKPAPRWVGANIAPLPDFLDSSKMATDIDAKPSVPSPVSIWRLPSKFQKNPSRIFWKNGVLMTSCFAILGKKNGKCLKAARMFSFEVRRNPKTPNGVKLNALQNSYLWFLIFFHFDSQNSKLHFFKNNYL